MVGKVTAAPKRSIMMSDRYSDASGDENGMVSVNSCRNIRWHVSVLIMFTLAKSKHYSI